MAVFYAVFSVCLLCVRCAFDVRLMFIDVLSLRLLDFVFDVLLVFA